MIYNDQDVKATQERIRECHCRLAEISQQSHPEEYEAVTSSCRLEIERMQTDVLDHLLRRLNGVSATDGLIKWQEGRVHTNSSFTRVNFVRLRLRHEELHLNFERGSN